MGIRAANRLVCIVVAINLVVGPLATAQQSAQPSVPAPSAPSAPAAAQSQSEVLKAADSAKASDSSAKTAATDAKQAADTAHTAATRADDAAKIAQAAADQAAKAAKDAADAAAKAAANVTAVQTSAKPSGSTTPSGRPPRPLRKNSKPPIDDYVPCLLDDNEIYLKRVLAQPQEPPPADPNAPLNSTTAATVAAAVTQYLASKATPPVTIEPGTSKKVRQSATAGQERRFTQVQNQFEQVIDPSEFIGLKLDQVPALVNKKVAEASKPADSSQPIIDKQAADALLVPHAENPSLKPAVQSGIPSVIASAVGAIGTSTITPPDDVACSFSVMQWKETSDNFGRRVANQYVALQVTVRNLNTQNEYIVHDIQIAVDTGLNRAQFGRFEAARDKLVVRNVAQRGQSEDRRNVIINTLQAVGAIAGGASTAVTEGLSGTSEAQDMAAAVAIFQGPFITGVTNIFPDHTIEHINHINDLAFSASSTSKTIVPIQGSVPLVTFLSQKPLEQLPFAHCGTSVRKKQWYRPFSGASEPDSDDPGASLYRFCSLDNYDSYGYPELTNYNLQPNYYMKPLPFRSWPGAALDVLKHRIFVVVGGVHFKEVAKQPTLTSISCAPTNDATLDLSKITGPNATCTLKGTDLDLVAQVSLQNATDANDKVQAQGTSSVSGDTTQADVAFLKADLAKLKGTSYKLYYALKGGGPQATSIVLTLKPLISFNPPSPFDFKTQTVLSTTTQIITLTNNGSTALGITQPIIVTGQDKDDFSDPAAKNVITNTCGASVPIGKDCKITVTFKPTAKGTRNAAVSITDDALGSPHTVELTGTGN